MFKLYRIVIYVILAGMVIVGCRKDPPIYEPYHTTPYELTGIPYVEAIPHVSFPDNPMTLEGVALGKRLFFDSTLSKDNTIACASCHHQDYAFSDRGRQFSLGVGNAIGNKNAIALFNIAYEPGPFFWDGRAPILDSQIVGPVPNPIEMHLAWSDALPRLQARAEYPDMYYKAFGQSVITKENTVKAIAQFLRTITSFHSKFDSVAMNLAQFTPSEQRGRDLFFNDPLINESINNHTVPFGHRLHVEASGVDCGHCHTAPFFTQESDFPKLMNDGIGDALVKVPSLRNLKFSAPYMNDGGMPNLDSVIAHYDHEVSPDSPHVDVRMYAKKYYDPTGLHGALTPHMELTPQEIADLKAFINTLNDYSLLTNP